ncbi:MAG: conjugal transfer protein TraR [Pseudomonadota bacterium]
MPDDIDRSIEIEERQLSAAIAARRVPIAPGAAGVCDDCDWWMPRLVGGRCSFCRDGRVRS